MVSLTAHMRYIQEEHNGLYVARQYGSQAKSVFKSIQRNMSNLRPEDIEDLKTTVVILPQAVQQSNSHNSSQNQHYMRGGFWQAQRFRGGYRGHGGPYFRQNHMGYQPRNIPPMREDIQVEDNNV